MSAGVFTFNTPCLRWKLIMAAKGQYGWPGFVAPYATRYLSKIVKITATPTIGGTPTTATQLFRMDKGGNVFFPSPGSALIDADFPYGLPLPTDPVHSETWQVSETHFNHVYNNGYNFIETDVTLSDPYDLGMLEADTDALLASVSVASMPWNTIQAVFGAGEQSAPDGPFTPTGLLTSLLPPNVTHGDNFFSGQIINAPSLNAAAWSIYAPGFVFSDDWFPNGCWKLISYVAMAGNYCKKTITLDYAQNVLNQVCASGQGDCRSPFKIAEPSGITPGQNSYVLIQPNCQCGD